MGLKFIVLEKYIIVSCLSTFQNNSGSLVKKYFLKLKQIVQTTTRLCVLLHLRSSLFSDTDVLVISGLCVKCVFVHRLSPNH